MDAWSKRTTPIQEHPRIRLKKNQHLSKVFGSSWINDVTLCLRELVPDDQSISFHLNFPVLYNILSLKNLTNDADFITYDLIDFVLEIFLENDDGGGLAALANDVHWTQDEINSGDFRKIAPGLIDVRILLLILHSTIQMIDHSILFFFSISVGWCAGVQGTCAPFGHGICTL